MNNSCRQSVQQKNIIRTYLIQSAYDPHTGISYSPSQIPKRNLIDLKTGSYCMPSTGHSISIQKAMQLGYISAILLDENVDVIEEYVQFRHHCQYMSNTVHNCSHYSLTYDLKLSADQV